MTKISEGEDDSMNQTSQEAQSSQLIDGEVDKTPKPDKEMTKLELEQEQKLSDDQSFSLSRNSKSP